MQNETRKILESDRFSFFLKRTFERNLETFSNYKPTDKEKLFYKESFKKILELIKLDSMIYGTFGIHPHETKDYKNIKTKFLYKFPPAGMNPY